MSLFKRSIIISLSFVTLIWVIHLFDYILGLDLWVNGIHPRDFNGLWGIIFAPFLHGDWSHLAANTPPLVILLGILFYAYPKSATFSLLGIWFISGLLTWFFARGNIHIGFSGINHGLMFLLFTIGVLRKDKRSIALAMIVFFLYGGMIWSIFPNDPKISFELHFFGAISGIIMAFVFRNKDSKLPEKRYSWEKNDFEGDSEEFPENDLIGDSWKLSIMDDVDEKQEFYPNKKDKPQ